MFIKLAQKSKEREKGFEGTFLILNNFFLSWYKCSQI